MIDHTRRWTIRTERWANDRAEESCVARRTGRHGRSIHPGDPQSDRHDSSIGLWEESMATCLAHLRTALSVIEELSLHPGSSPSDAYFYDQASGGVWVTLVALDVCAPLMPDQA